MPSPPFPPPPGASWRGPILPDNSWVIIDAAGNNATYDAGGRLLQTVINDANGVYVIDYAPDGVKTTTFIANDGRRFVLDRTVPQSTTVFPMKLVSTALWLIFLADIISFYADQLNWCSNVTAQAASMLSQLKYRYGDVVSYLVDQKNRLSRINISSGPGAMAATAWVVGAQARIQAAIDEVTSRKSGCTTAWTTWQTFDCLAWVSNTSPKNAMSDVRKHCVLYNDSVNTAIAWGKAVDEALKTFGSN